MIRENTDDYQGAIVSPIDKLISDIDNFTKSGRGSLTNSIQEGGNSLQDDTKDNNQDDRLSDSYIDEEENQIINLKPKLPEYGPSLLMPSKRNGKGKPEWQSIDGSNHLTKLSKGLEAGLKRQKQFVQPIDVVLTYAGSEATKAFEHYGVEDDVARGMLSSQCSMSVDLQNIVGQVHNTSEKPNQFRPLGVATVSVLSGDDHREHISIEKLARNEVKASLKLATKNRKSTCGPLRPNYIDAQGNIQMLTAGEGISLFPISTGKIGGGKSVTAYSRTSPKNAIDRQVNMWNLISPILGESASPLVMPPITSIGGTSHDAYLWWFEDHPGYTPPGAFQYITTTPQDRLASANAAAASRKKIESLAAMACIDSGSVINNIPMMMLDMNDDAVSQFVNLELRRYVMENYCDLQPVTMDRSDIIVKLEEFSKALGKHSDSAKFCIRSEDEFSRDTFISIQARDLYLSHAMPINRKRVQRLASGDLIGEHFAPEMEKMVARAFAQAYGRQRGEIMLRDETLHRNKIKMAQIVAYIPDDLSSLANRSNVVLFENALERALSTTLGKEHYLPIMVTTYRVPMTGSQSPIIGVRMMTHVKDVLDLLCEDTPELFEKVIAGISISEMKKNNKHKSRYLEIANFRNEVEALRDRNLRDIPFLSKWADVIETILSRMYRKGYQPKNPEAFNNGR